MAINARTLPQSPGGDSGVAVRIKGRLDDWCWRGQSRDAQYIAPRRVRADKLSLG